jgi:hypothetical protein
LSIHDYLQGKLVAAGEVSSKATAIGTRFNRVAPLPVVKMTPAELRERSTRGEVKITPRVKMSA